MYLCVCDRKSMYVNIRVGYYVCVRDLCVRASTWMCVYIVSTGVHTHVPVCTRLYVWARVPLCTCVYAYVFLCKPVVCYSLSVWMSVSVYLCVYVCVCFVFSCFLCAYLFQCECACVCTCVVSVFMLEALILWNGLVEWNSGMEYWNSGMPYFMPVLR